MTEVSFGFHAAYFAKDGRPHPPGWFGHCEAWFCQDGTWTFLDPQAKGLIVRSVWRHDDVVDELEARFGLCASILRIEAAPRQFRLPLHGMMSCASVCGSLVGIRALRPATLRRKLLALGAEVTHDAQARSSGGSGALA
jgi:hypothetical protein